MHNGPFGYHVCIVYEFLGLSLEQILKNESGNRIAPEVVHKITGQLTTALEFLHDHCRLIHTNIKPENVLLKIPEKDLVKLKGRDYQHRGNKKKTINNPKTAQTKGSYEFRGLRSKTIE